MSRVYSPTEAFKHSPGDKLISTEGVIIMITGTSERIKPVNITPAQAFSTQFPIPEIDYKREYVYDVDVISYPKEIDGVLGNYNQIPSGYVHELFVEYNETTRVLYGKGLK